MAEPEKKPSAARPDGSSRQRPDGPPREGSARSKAAVSDQPSRSGESGSQGNRSGRASGAKAQPRTRGEQNRVHVASGSGPRRPRDVKAGSGARLIAPLALAICAIAVFVVLTSQEDNSASKAAAGAASGAVTKSSATPTTEGAAAGPKRSRYTVKAGDSFSAIAEAQGVDIATLQALNPEVDPRALQPGQRLKLKE